MREKTQPTRVRRKRKSVVSEREKIFERKLGDSFGHDEFDVYSFAWFESVRDLYYAVKVNNTKKSG